MAAKTDMLKGKTTILLILAGIITVFFTLLFMYMNRGYANVIYLDIAQPVLIGQLLLLTILNGAIAVAILWYGLFNMATTLKIRTDITEIKQTVEDIASELAKDEEPKK